MRNAILQADVVAFAGADVDAIWQAFAGRGMGYFASTWGGNDFEPIEDFAVPPDCSVDPCHDITGTVTDKLSGDPVEGIRVSYPGQDSGFGSDLAATTAADGSYTIADVPDHDAYAEFDFTGEGYDPKVQSDVVVDGADLVVDKAMFRNWASLSGGATVLSFTGQDWAPVCGTNADGAFDGDLRIGWPSDSVNNDQGGTTGPRKATVRLAQVIHVDSFALASGPACGDDPDAGEALPDPNADGLRSAVEGGGGFQGQT